MDVFMLIIIRKVLIKITELGATVKNKIENSIKCCCINLEEPFIKCC